MLLFIKYNTFILISTSTGQPKLKKYSSVLWTYKHIISFWLSVNQAVSAYVVIFGDIKMSTFVYMIYVISFIDNIYVWLGNTVFRQFVEISMGTNCAPFMTFYIINNHPLWLNFKMIFLSKNWFIYRNLNCKLYYICKPN